jgi:hypothetical protein
MKTAADIASNAIARAVISATKTREPHNAYPRIYLYCVDPGTDCECWVVCAKGDPDAVPFLRENGF